MTPTRPHASDADPAARLARQLQEGYALIGQGRAAEAVALGRQLLEAWSGSAHVLVFAGEGFLASGDPASALEMIGRAVEASGGHYALKIKKAGLLQQMRRRSEAAALAIEAAGQATGNGQALWQAGNLLSNCNRPDQAIVLFEQALETMGRHPPLLYDLAVAQFFTGAFDEAERNLDALLAADPKSGHALYLRSTLRRQTVERNHLSDIEAKLAAGFANAANEASARYALAKELEDLGQHEQAFKALLAAAATKRGTLKYDIAAEIASLESMCAAYTAAAIATSAANAGGDEGEGAIFIVGMPRTGTTLVERLLVRSGKVRSAGELLDFGNLLGLATQRRLAEGAPLPAAHASLGIDFAFLGADYMRGARDAAGGSALFIDKMPVNFMYCGPIRKALPKAKIIHLVREPLDSCYAVFKTLFFNSYHFSYDQQELGDYYIAYRRMMRHWHEVMPDSILDVEYEALVTDTPAQARRILEWCGLEWDETVLDSAPIDAPFATASAAQVREPVHSRSINSSRRHLDGLAPLEARLAAEGLLADR